MSNTRDSGGFEAALEPWLAVEGVEVAALVSVDGLLVAWVGSPAYHRQAVAARAASALGALEALAAELGAATPAAIKAGLPGADTLLVPIGNDLALFILARAGALETCDRDRLAV